MRGALTSLAFWLCLLGAVGLYGLVVLSPKVVRWADIAAEVESNHRELLALQEQVRYWNQLTHELATNAAFRESLVSTSNGSGTSALDSISVGDALKYDRVTPVVDGGHIAPPTTHWGAMCHQVAESRLIQVVGLATSAGMLLFSFAMLLEATPQRRGPKLHRPRGQLFRCLGRLLRRYVSD